MLVWTVALAVLLRRRQLVVAPIWVRRRSSLAIQSSPDGRELADVHSD
jgi:hypothetical protein